MQPLHQRLHASICCPAEAGHHVAGGVSNADHNCAICRNAFGTRKGTVGEQAQPLHTGWLRPDKSFGRGYRRIASTNDISAVCACGFGAGADTAGQSAQAFGAGTIDPAGCHVAPQGTVLCIANDNLAIGGDA
ncbi:hypothetical protein EAH72_33005 [Pseudomonas caspiana]|nr:hypothetical protein [Pseudomonas caspiana]TPG88540.1 hypothetical protein EAH72_33005 [Pseudomonas caspiana]